MKYQHSCIACVFFIVCLPITIFAQSGDSLLVKKRLKESFFSGSIAITNNGISLVPTFSLGKPAGMIALAMGKNRFSFEPEFKFSLEGKPWSTLFWFRYKAIHTNIFSLRVGAHPALNFRTQTVDIGSEKQDAIVARRFLATEVAPSFSITKNISVGSYYLFSRGFDKGAPRSSHFITLNANFSQVPLAGDFYLKAIPQIFYLNQDGNDGFFATATLTLAQKKWPVSASILFNKQLKAGIVGAKDFIWSGSLIYSFGKKYVPL